MGTTDALTERRRRLLKLARQRGDLLAIATLETALHLRVLTLYDRIIVSWRRLPE